MTGHEANGGGVVPDVFEVVRLFECPGNKFGNICHGARANRRVELQPALEAAHGGCEAELLDAQWAPAIYVGGEGGHFGGQRVGRHRYHLRR
jgi:hypothetical protein